MKKAWLQQQISENESKLIRYVKSLGLDLDLARDVVQDGFLKLWEQNEKEVRGHERQWLFTVCRNRAFDLLRKQKSHDAKNKSIAREAVGQTASPEEQMMQTSENEKLNQILEVLTPSEQEVLRLKFQQDLSYKEISAITGMTVNHVGVLIHNTVAKLRRTL
jgi:RNA polymerase sigma factor (sigma-70 family)